MLLIRTSFGRSSNLHQSLLPIQQAGAWGDGREQKFYYDYDGGLLRMERIDGSGNLIERRDYAGSFLFEGDSLSEVLTEEGRLIPWRMVKPDFFVRDHLGSVRAVVSGDGRVLETNSYYPYGMKIDALSSTNYASSDLKNRYKYNGKEEFEDLQWLNYGARFYDAAVGRWWVRDPKAEKYYALTPYSYVGGNPVRMVDPNGDTIRISTGSNSIVYSAGMKYAGNDEFVSTTIEYLNLIYGVFKSNNEF